MTQNGQIVEPPETHPHSALECLDLVVDVALGGVPLALLQLQPVRQRQLVRLERQRQGDELVLRKSQGCQMAKFDPFFSLDCAGVEGVGAQSKERKGSNFAAQHSGAIVQKPEGPNTKNLKIWL